ncbi:glycosyltransferase family 2 protein [Shewanella sp. 1_MG-2023]|uniref:glycosyltransferase family 2 protein n=1 Tax=unclassified Shewanella TaxID=196818 RepID=UPI0026E3B4C1|nr:MULTISPECIES: glycosyltransferase family 2 protein [unclassified Shewanella]MDO6610116.1 glycosyltransferase family 2 protein [Shewanella sp. 7_MG-2023]MDO6769742.1 glycosyltransferase family 2 protein [Shewanella sp. 2_MG-2023]MDO6792806.1 glycosyltransferase family 2 protein [Shewanella sp. 1_MG-2023]
MKVSVLIPVYGVEKFLDVFLKSLCAQTLIDCEFIVVNDASPDNSHDIIIKYLEVDSRFKYINKKLNQGEMQARQDAFKLATGDFIINIDSDDYISPGFLKGLYELAIDNNLEMVLSNVISVDEDGRPIDSEYRVFKDDFLFNKDNLKRALSLPYSSWSRMTKKSVLDKYNYSFLQGETSLTRLQFTGDLRSGFSSTSIYFYRQRLGSLSSFENSSKKYSASYGCMKIDEIYNGDTLVNNGEGFSHEFKLFRFINMSKLIFLSNLNNGSTLNYIKEISYLKSKYSVSYLKTFFLLFHFPLKTKVFSIILYLGLSPLLLLLKKVKK